jgi:hypothetical protein
LRRTDESGYNRHGHMDAPAEDNDYAFVDYSMNNVSAQQDGDILVAVFTLDAKMSENGRFVTSEPRPSLVTFVRVDVEWKLASDAFFSR